MLGHYKVGRTLGKGAFSKVKLGTDTRDGQQYAVKIISKEALAKSHQEELLRREVAMMKKLEHPHIVKMKEVFQTQNHIYLVLELVTGGELLDLILKKKKLDEDETRYYFQQIVTALHYCHSFNIAHRDLKPENMLLTSDSPPILKISDFGLANIHQNNPDGSIGLFQSLCGTPDYVAPEVIKEEGYNGLNADIWSLGVILFVMLAGYPPFNEPSIPVMFERIKSGKFHMDHSFSPSAADLISKMIVPDPSHRITLNGIIYHPWFRAGGWNDNRLTSNTKPNELTSEDLRTSVTDLQENDVNVKNEKGNHGPISTINTTTENSIEKKNVHDHITQFRCRGSPSEAVQYISDVLEAVGANPKVVETKNKITGYLQTIKGVMAYALKIERVGELEESLARVMRTRGDALEFHTFYHRILENTPRGMVILQGY